MGETLRCALTQDSLGWFQHAGSVYNTFFFFFRMERRFVGISSYQSLREGGETCGGMAGIIQAARLSLLGAPIRGNAGHMKGRGGEQGGANAKRVAS